MNQHYAIIGGTGLTSLNEFKLIKKHCVETPFGYTSSEITEGVFEGSEEEGAAIYFLSRHGSPHVIPPHKINYRANIWALKHLKIENVIAVNAVGGINPQLDAGSLCVPDQLIDYTYRRENTFFDVNNSEHIPVHIDFTEPYSKELREKIIALGDFLNLPIMKSACYGCVEGPRLETRAEINRMDKDGCDIVGMTGMPEAGLAREMEINYASICLVVNKAAGRGDGAITMAMINQTLKDGMEKVYTILRNL